MDKESKVLDWLSARLNLSEVFSLLTSYGLFYAEIDTRKKLSEALQEAREQPLPSYARWPRVLGLMVVVLLSIEFLTGALLAVYYLPTPDAAHTSLGVILRDVHLGWLVHHIHFWGAQLLIAILIVRVVRFFAQGVYRAPRELIWVFAALLLLVCFHLDLTGRALPMTSEGFWSTVRGMEIVNAVPIYGSALMFFLGGAGIGISDLTLIRFYVLHVGVLPFAALTLIYFHFSSIRRVGLQEVKGEKKKTGVRVLRGHVVNLAIILTILFGVVVSLAVLVPPRFEAAADPFSTVPGVGPPWYLLAPFGFLEWTAGVLPQWLAGSVLFVLFLGFLALPFFERSAPGSKRRKLSFGLGALVLLAWVFFTIYGAGVV